MYLNCNNNIILRKKKKNFNNHQLKIQYLMNFLRQPNEVEKTTTIAYKKTNGDAYLLNKVGSGCI